LSGKLWVSLNQPRCDLVYGSQRKYWRESRFSSKQSVTVTEFIKARQERRRLCLDAEEWQALEVGAR